MQTVGPETSFKPGLGAMEIACNAMEIAAKQTLCEEASLKAGLEAGLRGDGNCRQRRDLARMRQAPRQASRLWKLQQRRDVLG